VWAVPASLVLEDAVSRGGLAAVNWALLGRVIISDTDNGDGGLPPSVLCALRLLQPSAAADAAGTVADD